MDHPLHDRREEEEQQHYVAMDEAVPSDEVQSSSSSSSASSSIHQVLVSDKKIHNPLSPPPHNNKMSFNKNNNMRLTTSSVRPVIRGHTPQERKRDAAAQRRTRKNNPNPTAMEILRHLCGKWSQCASWLLIFFLVLLLGWGPFIIAAIIFDNFERQREQFLQDTLINDICDISLRLQVFYRYCHVWGYLYLFQILFRIVHPYWTIFLFVMTLLNLVLGLVATVFLTKNATCPSLYPDYFQAARNATYFLATMVAVWIVVVIVLKCLVQHGVMQPKVAAEEETNGEEEDTAAATQQSDSRVLLTNNSNGTEMKNSEIV